MCTETGINIPKSNRSHVCPLRHRSCSTLKTMLLSKVVFTHFTLLGSIREGNSVCHRHEWRRETTESCTYTGWPSIPVCLGEAWVGLRSQYNYYLCPLHSLERLSLFQQTVMVRQVPRKLGIWWYHLPLALATLPSYQTPPPRPPPAAPFLSLCSTLLSPDSTSWNACSFSLASAHSFPLFTLPWIFFSSTP